MFQSLRMRQYTGSNELYLTGTRQDMETLVELIQEELDRQTGSEVLFHLGRALTRPMHSGKSSRHQGMLTYLFRADTRRGAKKNDRVSV